jgi:hypothetical protein
MIGLFLSLRLIVRRWTLLRFSGFSLSDISSVIYGCSDCEGEEVAVVETAPYLDPAPEQRSLRVVTLKEMGSDTRREKDAEKPACELFRQRGSIVRRLVRNAIPFGALGLWAQGWAAG